MQKWRRGANTPMPLSPKEFGECIDDCIRMLRRMSDEQYNELYGIDLEREGRDCPNG